MLYNIESVKVYNIYMYVCVCVTYICVNKEKRDKNQQKFDNKTGCLYLRSFCRLLFLKHSNQER